MSLWWGTDPFADLVAKATSELLPAGQEDIALNLEICDHVRAKQVQPKQAMQAIKKRISDNNPNVVLLALGLTDICIKNGGDHFLAEVASREFMDNLVFVLKKPSGVNHDVKSKALALIQDWAQISEAKPAQMAYIIQVYRILRSDPGFEFPAKSANAASAAFVETLTAPEWVDGDVCMRCRTQFTTFNRKHHCRNCGNVFCQQCSTHTMALPWYGVGQDVRVCDGCFTKKAPPKIPASAGSAKLNRSSSSVSPSVYPSGRGGSGSASHHRSATLGSKPKRSKREDDDLALAIKLSLEDSDPRAQASSSRATPSEPSAQQRATRQPNGRMLEGTDADDDPDLAAAIAASLRDYAPPQPSAPIGLEDDGGPSSVMATHSAVASHDTQAQSKLPLPPSLELPPSDVDSLLTFAQTIANQEEQQRQQGIHGVPPNHQAQSLYQKASAARPKMARSLDEAGRRQGVLLSMHDKLTEAVRLYDRLLDAQMSRPAGGYAQMPPQQYAPYGQAPQQQQQHQPAPYPPSSPDPFVHQRRYGQGYHASEGQQQHENYSQPAQHYPHYPAQDHQLNGYAAPAPAREASGGPMYPSLPATGPSTLPQEPQSTGMSSQTTSSVQQYPYSPMQHMQPQPSDSVQPYTAYAQPDSQSRQVHSPTQQRVPSFTPGELAPNAVGYVQQQQEAAMTAAAAAAAAAAAPSPSGSHAGHWQGVPHAQSHPAAMYGHPQYVSTAHGEYPGVPSNVSQTDGSGAAAVYPVYDYAQFAPQAQPVHGNGIPPSTSNPDPITDVASPSTSSSQADLSTFQRMMSPSNGTQGGPPDGTSPASAGGVLAGPGGVKVTAGIGAHGGVYEPGQGPSAQPFANSSSSNGSAEYNTDNHNNQNRNTAATLASLPSAPTNLPQPATPEWQRPVAVAAEAPALIDL